MLAKSWILGSALGFWAASSLLRAHVVSPKCSSTSWKRLQLDVTPEEAQRDGRNHPPRAAGLSNPMDVGENPAPVAPALHRNLQQWLWSQLSTWGAPAAPQGGFGWALGSWKSGEGGENPERGHHTQQRRVSSALACGCAEEFWL